MSILKIIKQFLLVADVCLTQIILKIYLLEIIHIL